MGAEGTARAPRGESAGDKAGRGLTGSWRASVAGAGHVAVHRWHRPAARLRRAGLVGRFRYLHIRRAQRQSPGPNPLASMPSYDPVCVPRTASRPAILWCAENISLTVVARTRKPVSRSHILRLDPGPADYDSLTLRPHQDVIRKRGIPACARRTTGGHVHAGITSAMPVKPFRP